jgi:cytochrome P450
LCSIFFYLSRYPSAYATLASEIRSQFESLDEICSGQQLARCNYLLACIDETLRLSPPIVTALFREAGSTGAIVDGQFIPGGTIVGTGIYSIHHNPEYFQQPHDFIPERWLRGFNDILAIHGTGAYMPFSRGSRACIGRSLSYLELQITVAMVMWEYDFRPAVGPDMEVGSGDPLSPYPGRRNPHEFQLVDRGTSGKRGPVLQFRRRQRLAKKSDACHPSY